jgi:hypothetical protein
MYIAAIRKVTEMTEAAECQRARRRKGTGSMFLHA